MEKFWLYVFLTQYFFGQYCKETGKKLHAFKHEFGSGLEKAERDIDDVRCHSVMSFSKVFF